MSELDPRFIQFNESVADIPLPEKFTFPFFYQPHPLAIKASEQLQQHLMHQTDWQHNFGVTQSHAPEALQSLPVIGKMFGVLVVKDAHNQLGFLAAFSGKVADQNILPYFVPPVFDMLSQDSFFKDEYEAVNTLSHQLTVLQSDPNLASLTENLKLLMLKAEQEIAQFRQQMIENRKTRKTKRSSLTNLTEDEQKTLPIELSRQSVQDKHQLNSIKASWEHKCGLVQQQLDALTNQIDSIKQQRKQVSNTLQHKLFAQYRFLNIRGESRDLTHIFKDAPNQQPPAAAGECAAPKLLQYAFQQQFTPITMQSFGGANHPSQKSNNIKTTILHAMANVGLF